ncbi:MAG: DUF1292 domain-containing protein [Clostridia bacterium]|nr:DUF1292 domain-containing protein [Clostridia bacterium]
MTNPFENEDEEWVEISDANGKKAALRHLATIRYGEKTYFVLGAIKESEDGDGEGGFLIVRQDETLDGAQQYVVASDEDEIESIVGDFVMHAILSQLDAGQEDDGTCSCGLPHVPGDFCCCGQPEYLQ